MWGDLLRYSPSRYDVELYQRIEQLIDKKLALYPTVEEEVLGLMERVSEAQRYARMVRGQAQWSYCMYLSRCSIGNSKH